MARRPGPKTRASDAAAPPAPIRPSSVVDAYDFADLTPATKGLWPEPPATAERLAGAEASNLILERHGRRL